MHRLTRSRPSHLVILSDFMFSSFSPFPPDSFYAKSMNFTLSRLSHVLEQLHGEQFVNVVGDDHPMLISLWINDAKVGKVVGKTPSLIASSLPLVGVPPGKPQILNRSCGEISQRHPLDCLIVISC